ncbi:MAG: hypothetical protein KGL43_24115 [Burkholderiales bacterium]|nr:hypothetical protein [Burkholderiales bacterium]MDE2456685.1 hypothetical protein [Burkholderiales bacterium]
MARERNRWWFPAKRYGWGWGLPCRWQGWVVLGVYGVLLVAAIPVLEPAVDPWRYFGFTTLATLALVAICWVTGEPPRWRWGGKGR